MRVLFISLLLTLMPIATAASTLEAYWREPSESALPILLTTDLDDWFKVTLLISHAIDDSFCSYPHETVTTWVHPEHDNGEFFNLLRDGDHHRALYEWHLCIEIAGTLYRGWRGFDLGPESDLQLGCFLDRKIVEKYDDAVYLCTANNVKLEETNYNEAAEFCWSTDKCKRFESIESYRLFIAKGVQSIASNMHVGPLTVYDTNVSYSADDFTQPWSSRFKTEFLVDNFSQLEGIQLKRTSGYLAREVSYEFEPHIVQEDLVSYYSVACSRRGMDQGTARCQVTLNEAFYADDPSANFAIEGETLVDDAKWVFNAFELPEDLSHVDISMVKQNVRQISIVDDIASIEVGRSWCENVVQYRVVGDKKSLEYIGRHSCR